MQIVIGTAASGGCQRDIGEAKPAVLITCREVVKLTTSC